jgi:hypothetical protein
MSRQSFIQGHAEILWCTGIYLDTYLDYQS